MERISELGTTLAVTSNWVFSRSLILLNLMMEAISSFETPALIRASLRHFSVQTSFSQISLKNKQAFIAMRD
jgi:hypothetical protein